MSTNASLALSQVARIEQLCDFLAHPALEVAFRCSVPVTMPQSEGSLGFDTPLWVGLGLVGLWSALDAFAERAVSPAIKNKCPTCGLKCLPSRLMSSNQLDVADGQALLELEDLRHLFAHNYAGFADEKYFELKRKRHVLARRVSVSLSSGAIFDGEYISLASAHLRYYAGQARGVIGKLS
jgi:hypothetical protein